MVAIESFPARKSTYTLISLTWHARSTRLIVVLKRSLARWKVKFMRNANLSPLTVSPPSRWQMPISPEGYSGRHPHLAEEEKALMQQYAAAPASFMTGGRARNVLHRLERFEAPFMDIVGLTSPMDTTVTAARRYLFTWMVQTEYAFWAWPKEVWIEAIQNAPGAKHASGTRFWMLLLAYLFCDML